MRRILLPTAALLSLLLPAAAHAATGVELKKGRLTVRSDDRMANLLTVSRLSIGGPVWHLRDRGSGLNPGEGCEGDAAVGRLIVCRGEASSIRLHLGAGPDRLTVGAWEEITWGVDAFGEEGDDRLSGTPRGDSLYGGPGNDQLRGGRDADTLVGGPGDDDLRGGPQADFLGGGAGHDRLAGGPGSDWIYGHAGADTLSGDAGDDRLFGGKGADRIFGGPGNDRIVGGSGADVLVGGPGRDVIVAGAGSQLVRARDGERDRVDCGPGLDVAVVDRLDRVRGCERVTVR